MDKPQEPYKPWPPMPHDYKEKVKQRHLYSLTEEVRDRDGYEDEDDEREKPVIPIKDLTLGWLLRQLPEGVTPDQVKIDFGFDIRSMSADHYLHIYYDETVPARPEEYKAAQAEYQTKLEKYEKDKEAYKVALREWEIQEAERKIREAEERLARLKQ